MPAGQLGAGGGIQEVVALVLRVVPTELGSDVLGQRVHLQRQRLTRREQLHQERQPAAEAPSDHDVAIDGHEMAKKGQAGKALDGIKGGSALHGILDNGLAFLRRPQPHREGRARGSFGRIAIAPAPVSTTVAANARRNKP